MDPVQAEQPGFLLRIVLYGVALLLAGAALYLEMWVLFAFSLLSLFLARQLSKGKAINAPEHSMRLRQITFVAQCSGLLALACTTRLWAVAVVAIALLAVGHACAYRFRNKPQL